MNMKNESIGARLARLRRAQNITQEALADKLGVSRQAVSKWESDLAYPETDKLLRLSRLYGCTVDDLLTGEGDKRASTEEAPPSTPTPDSPPNLGERAAQTWQNRPRYFEYKSQKTVGGLPLVHINIGMGRRATGVLAIGLRARGIVAVGLAAMGVFSVGVASMGVISVAVLSLALLLSVGCVSVGAIAIGAIALGLLAIGALSVGLISVGAAAFGSFLAIGDMACGGVAIGKTMANGEFFSHVGSIALPAADLPQMEALLAEHVPPVFREIARILLRFICR